MEYRLNLRKCQYKVLRERVSDYTALTKSHNLVVSVKYQPLI